MTEHPANQFRASEQIDDICDAFEEVWRSGEVPDVQHWLGKASPELQARLLPQLVRVDLEYRLRDGVSDLSLHEYIRKFGLNPEEISLQKSAPTDRPDANADTIAWKDSRTVRPNLTRTPAGEFRQRYGVYELLEEIGRGGMGVVYKARHVTLGRIVALKTIREAALDDEEIRKRFRTEVEAVARLDHPAITCRFSAVGLCCE